MNKTVKSWILMKLQLHPALRPLKHRIQNLWTKQITDTTLRQIWNGPPRTLNVRCKNAKELIVRTPPARGKACIIHNIWKYELNQIIYLLLVPSPKPLLGNTPSPLLDERAKVQPCVVWPEGFWHGPIYPGEGGCGAQGRGPTHLPSPGSKAAMPKPEGQLHQPTWGKGGSFCTGMSAAGRCAHIRPVFLPIRGSSTALNLP